MQKAITKIFLASAVFAILDQISKAYVDLFTPKILITDFLVLRQTENTGIAFGIDLHPTLLITLTPILFFFILHYSTKELNISSKLAQTGIALILGGGLGNYIDRITIGHVIDFISVHKFPILNLADVFITVGVLMILLFYPKIKKIT